MERGMPSGMRTVNTRLYKLAIVVEMQVWIPARIQTSIPVFTW